MHVRTQRRGRNLQVKTDRLNKYHKNETDKQINRRTGRQTEGRTNRNDRTRCANV